MEDRRGWFRTLLHEVLAMPPQTRTRLSGCNRLVDHRAGRSDRGVAPHSSPRAAWPHVISVHGVGDMACRAYVEETKEAIGCPGKVISMTRPLQEWGAIFFRGKIPMSSQQCARAYAC